MVMVTTDRSGARGGVSFGRIASASGIAACVYFTLALTQAQTAPTVQIGGGTLRGALAKTGVAYFKGIPYAQPPTGDLRWREPMPVRAWNGTRDATDFGAVCIQEPGQIPNAADIASEDCLTLNVWTPRWPSPGRLPVMVWIHGGGNNVGGAVRPEMDGENLSRHGVIVVTFNYRLGWFGFFSHPALTAESSHRASGNQGILDQISALTWVRDNIARFGGDPGNITLFGESSGALDVNVLMTSRLTQGLFRRAISQSGPAVRMEVPLTLSEAEHRGQTLSARWVRAGSPLDRLRAVGSAEILDSDRESTRQVPYLGVMIDGYVLSRSPAEAFASGAQHPLPIIVGSNAHERRPGSTPTADLRAAIVEAYGPLAERAHALYVDVDPEYRSPENQWATDTSFRCTSVAELAWHAEAGHPAYQYEFARVLPGREELGSTHASEISFVFGNLDRRIAGVGPPAHAAALDMAISAVMQRYWVNFAKTGNPNGEGLPVWPMFRNPERAYLQFRDTGPTVKEGLRRPYCDLYLENVNRVMGNR